MVTQVSIGNGQWLAPAAAASFQRVCAQIAHRLQVTEAGRTRAEQQAHRDRYEAYLRGGPWAPFAALPGQSPHEFGNAIDTNERLVAILNDHGWYRPLANEPWHFVYYANRDNHIGETAGTGNNTAPTTPPTPDVPATPTRRYDMTSLYYRTGTNPTEYALAGDSPGTSANWLETKDLNLATQWARQHGDAAELSTPSFIDFKRFYLEPLKLAK